MDERPDGFAVADTARKAALPVGEVMKAVLGVPPRFVMHGGAMRPGREGGVPDLDTL